jgi:hypothetical protein
MGVDIGFGVLNGRIDLNKAPGDIGLTTGESN